VQSIEILMSLVDCFFLPLFLFAITIDSGGSRLQLHSLTIIISSGELGDVNWCKQ